MATAGHSVEASDTRAGARDGCLAEDRGFGVPTGLKWLFCLQVRQPSRDLDPIENSHGGAFSGDIRAISRGFFRLFGGDP